jgi:polar amino acid transport system substrate-binding protein
VIRAGASLTARPVIFKDAQGRPDGLDRDIASALEAKLGVTFRFEDVGTFSNVLPGLLSRKYDIALSGITDTRAREQGLDHNGVQLDDGFDFVDYFMAGIGILVRQGNPERIGSIDDLCNRRVVVKKGTIHDDFATRQVNACQKLGRSLTVLRADGDDEAVDVLRAGKASAYLTDYPKAAFDSQDGGNGHDFELVPGPQLQPMPYGIALRKGDTALETVLMKAMNTIIMDGTYRDILTRRELSTGAIQNSVVNGGG